MFNLNRAVIALHMLQLLWLWLSALLETKHGAKRPCEQTHVATCASHGSSNGQSNQLLLVTSKAQKNTLHVVAYS